MLGVFFKKLSWTPGVSRGKGGQKLYGVGYLFIGYNKIRYRIINRQITNALKLLTRVAGPGGRPRSFLKKTPNTFPGFLHNILVKGLYQRRSRRTKALYAEAKKAERAKSRAEWKRTQMKKKS